ncbi:undecaprenyl-diphosphatase [Kaistia hirudinis]|uniref:Undecaprenyl-diphosphatase n=1 Tax=Kaistia hirudinis TaxID=1293440 RepID=A0A840AT91_9HYPH|nr:phosphatase PAP2 family protein [Kaistia hirudinis]MBB3932438.1 undecaprenyl-diphosphatase [Kaistia hirudinis]
MQFPPLVRLREFLPLATLFVPAGLVLGFIMLGNEVKEGETLHLDESVLLALRVPGDLADPIGPTWLELAMKDTTSLGSTTVLTFIMVASIIYLLLSRKREMALLLLVSVGGGTLLSSVLKIAYNRPRPELVAHIVDVSTASFPSGHAMMSAITYLTLGALLASIEPNPRLKTFLMGTAVFLTLAVGVSRVYLGVHYPTDVLAGWVLGSGWAMACLGISRLLGGRGTGSGQDAGTHLDQP